MESNLKTEPINNSSYKYLIIFLLGLILLIIYRGPDYIRLWTVFPNKPGFGLDFKAYHNGSSALYNKCHDIIYNVEKLKEWNKSRGEKTRLGCEYPPLLFVIYLPFALLKPSQSLWLNFYLSHLILCLNIILLLSVRAKTWGIRKTIIIFLMILPVFFLFSPTIDCLFAGQLTIIMLFLVTLFSIFYAKGKKTASTFILAFSISLKIFPVIFLVYFLVKRDYKSIIKTLIFLILLMLPVIIYTGSIHIYIVYLSNIPKSIYFDYFANQSLSAYINSYFKPTDYTTPLLNSPLTGNILIWLITFVIFYVTLKPVKIRCNTEKIYLEIGTFILLLLICIPRSWPHYHMYLLLTIFLIYLGIEHNIQSKSQYFILYLILFFATGLIDGEVSGITEDIILRIYLLKYHLIFYLLLFLWFISMFILTKVEKND